MFSSADNAERRAARRDPDISRIVGRHLDAAGLFGRHFAIRWPLSVRKSPDNGCGVRKPPGSTGGAPRAHESRPATLTAPRMSKSRPKTRMACQQVSKAARQCGAGAGVRFSPDATTTAPAPAVSRCAAVVLLRACRESALIPRGYERAHTGSSHRHRARGR